MKISFRPSAIILYLLIIVILTGLALTSMSSPETKDEIGGYVFMFSSGVLCVALLYLSAKSTGLVRKTALLMGLGYVTHFVADITIFTFPGEELQVPLFSDAWWFMAYSLFFAAGISGLLFLGNLTMQSYRRDWIIAVIVALVVGVACHFLFSYDAWTSAETTGAQLVYLTDAAMPPMVTAVATVFGLLAWRSAGGEFATLFRFLAVGMVGAMIADVLYAMDRAGYEWGDPSDWARLIGQSAILFMVAQMLARIRNDAERASVAAAPMAAAAPDTPYQPVQLPQQPYQQQPYQQEQPYQPPTYPPVRQGF